MTLIHLLRVVRVAREEFKIQNSKWQGPGRDTAAFSLIVIFNF